MKTNIIRLCLCGLLLCLSLSVFADNKVLVNANAWTGNPEQPWAQTIVIEGSRIAAVGDLKLAAKYPHHQRIDAGGKLVLPGFIDNHTHFMDGSASLVGIDTLSAGSKSAFTKTVQDYASNLADGEWITGGLWDHELWGGELPRKDWIDAVSQKNPVFLLRRDGHMAIANTLVLQAAGINKNTVDPEGGLIVRDDNGEPTGILKDNAMNLVFKVIPQPTDQQTARMFDAGTAEALKNGVTQIHNMGTWENIAVFEKAKAEGRLKIRTYYVPYIVNRHKLAERIKQQGKGDLWLRFGGVKELVDGSLGSTTAWFYEPYDDAPETNGFPLMKMEDLKKSLQESQDYGLQLVIHGIGDQTNDKILDLFEELKVKGQRARIEHAQHLSADAIKRFSVLEVVPSMHPYHAIDDGQWAEKRIGAERLNGTYAFKDLFDAGAKVSFGSDWSVAPLSPLSGIYAAVTRRTLDGKNPKGWVPQQKISVEQAVIAYTVNNAWSGNQEQDLGTIAVGKLADLVILSDNIFEIPAEEIINTRVNLTMIDGKVAYQE